MIKEALMNAILGKFPNLESDIKNCPDSLWDKRYGGDYYWQQVFHALVSTMGMLSSDALPVPELPISKGLAFLDEKYAKASGVESERDYSVPHSKEMMLDVAELTKSHIKKYFDQLNDDVLFELVDFFGQQMPLFNRLEIISAHIMYHVGALDAALRDNGAIASM